MAMTLAEILEGMKEELDKEYNLAPQDARDLFEAIWDQLRQYSRKDIYAYLTAVDIAFKIRE